MQRATAQEMKWALSCVVIVMSLNSCAQSAHEPVTNNIAASRMDFAEVESAQPELCVLSRIVELWEERKRQGPSGFAIGPGDVITISVPELEELQAEQVRVSSDGTIALSLIGVMDVAGMDENQLRAALVQRLAKFMKYPRVDLFVKKYEAREVAVTGAVQKPGRYDLANMNQSLLDMIGRAGGMTTAAAQKVIFVPAGAELGPTNRTGSDRNVPLASAEVPAGAIRSTALEENSQHPLADSETGSDLKGRNWMVINLGDPNTHACLGIPTRPGDVIIVPVAGEVMVQGWVNKPGAFPITPGMTVLGAVSAAGGASFSSSAELIRSDSSGKHVAEDFNLADLKNGAEADVPVESGDVVVIKPSLVGAIPYALGQILSHFGGGVYLPVP